MGLQLAHLQEVKQMDVADAFVVAAASPFIEADHILGIVVRDSKKVAELAFPSLSVAHLEGGLHINACITVQGDKVHFFLPLLADEHFGVERMEMKVHGIFDRQK